MYMTDNCSNISRRDKIKIYLNINAIFSHPASTEVTKEWNFLFHCHSIIAQISKSCCGISGNISPKFVCTAVPEMILSIPQIVFQQGTHMWKFIYHSTPEQSWCLSLICQRRQFTERWQTWQQGSWREHLVWG